MKTLKMSIAAALFVSTMTSCKQEEPVGPAGPQGPQGADGTSLVINGIFTSGTYPGGSDNYDYVLPTPLLTEQILATHVIEAYVHTSAGWTSLPFEYPIGGGVTLLYRGFADAGEFKVNMKRSDGQIIDAGDPLSSMNPLTLKLIVFDVHSMTPHEIDKARAALLAR